MNKEDEFNMWMKQWDKASASWDKEPKQHKVRTSFFNDAPLDDDYNTHDISQEEADDWIEIYNRSLENDENQEQLITENMMDDEENDEDEGFGPLVRGDKQMTKGDITYYNNPTHFASIGPDAARYDGPVRVTKSWSGGKEVDELDDMKRRLEVMERRVHRADVFKDSAKKKKLKSELKTMREEIHKLSEILQSKPDKDVT